MFKNKIFIFICFVNVSFIYSLYSIATFLCLDKKRARDDQVTESKKKEK